MPTSTESGVLEANRTFYDAFQKRDSAAMEHLWAEEHASSCIHPGWAPLVGRQAVMASWRAIFGSPDPPRIQMTDAHAVVLGTAAFVTCIEHLTDGDHRGDQRVRRGARPMADGPPSRRPHADTAHLAQARLEPDELTASLAKLVPREPRVSSR